MNLLKGALSSIIIIAIVFGFKFYHKSSSHQDVKAEMLEFCQGVVKCEEALAAYFDTCFDQSYGLGSRRQSGDLDNEAFVECINSRGGVELLTMYH